MICTADLAGCSERFVHTLETGKTTVRLDEVLDVLTVLGLTLNVGRGQLGGITTGPELDALLAGTERFR